MLQVYRHFSGGYVKAIKSVKIVTYVLGQPALL